MADTLKASMVLDQRYVVGPVNDHLYDAFVEHLGRDIYGGLYDPESPQADDLGFRRDVIQMVRELKIPQVRYPGGNFSSGYHWEDGIGPVESRPRRLDLAFQSTETNRIGTDEFQQWAARAGTEAMMTVNLGTRGIEDAKNLFEYCNHPGGTYWSDLRRKFGSEAPYGIRTWCLGNEIDGDWQIGHHTADDYGKLACETAKTFKWMDPTAEIIVCGTSSPQQPTLGSWEETVLDYCYDQADLVDMHIYYRNEIGDTQNYMGKALAFDRYIADGIAALDFVKAKKQSRRTLNLAFNEWNVWFLLEDTDRRTEKWGVAPSLLEDFFTLEDALAVGDMLLSMLKRADRVHTACISQLVNVNAPFMTEVGGPRSYRQPTYYPFLHASLFGRGTALQTPLQVERYDSREFTDVPYLSAAAVFAGEREELTLFCLNRSVSDAMALTCDLRSFEHYELIEHLALTGEDPKAHNSFDHPDRVAPRRMAGDRLEGGRLKALLPKLSWNVLRFRRRAR